MFPSGLVPLNSYFSQKADSTLGFIFLVFLFISLFVVFKVNVLSLTILLELNLEGLGAVILDGLLEPWVLQSLFGRDTLFRIIYKNSAKEIDKLFVKRGSEWDDFLICASAHTNRQDKLPNTHVELLHGFDIFLGCFARLRVGIVELTSSSEITSTTGSASPSGVIGDGTHDAA